MILADTPVGVFPTCEHLTSGAETYYLEFNQGHIQRAYAPTPFCIRVICPFRFNACYASASVFTKLRKNNREIRILGIVSPLHNTNSSYFLKCKKLKNKLYLQHSFDMGDYKENSFFRLGMKILLMHSNRKVSQPYNRKKYNSCFIN